MEPKDFPTLRIHHQNKSKRDEHFFTLGIKDREQFFDWYLISVYHSARHMLRAYIYLTTEDAPVHRIHDIVGHTTALGNANVSFDLLLQCHDLANLNGCAYVPSVEKRVDTAYGRIKKQVTNLFAAKRIPW